MAGKIGYIQEFFFTAAAQELLGPKFMSKAR